MLDLLVATVNPHKIDEISAVLADWPLSIHALTEFAQVPLVEETGTTFTANACQKALAYTELVPYPVLADDSGLCVDALGGAPGVYSARWSGVSGPERTSANNAKLLRALEGLPTEKRSACFVCAMAVACQGRLLFTVRGECTGRITTAPRGQHGFGYDPLFEVPAYGQTFAELGPALKNKISHRARALAQLRQRIQTLL